MMDDVMHIIAWIIMGFALVRLAVALTNHLSPLYLRDHGMLPQKRISVLIPARNEQENLPGLLEALMVQTYQNFELLVYDDLSEDDTPQILGQYSQKDERISWIRGERLPEGWTGKTHACHQLAEKARGEVILFLDADVMVSRDLLQKAVGRFSAGRLSLLSVFPHQIMHSRGEWLTVPLMNWILLSLLPMVLIRKSNRSSFAAANGQFMMFDAGDYKRHWWHRRVKNSLVEDIIISRLVKQEGLPTATLLGKDDILCRMYRSYREGVHGFAKNVTEFFGGSIFFTLLFVFMVLASIVLIPFALGWEWLAVYLLMAGAIRVIISLTSRQKVWNNLFLHPLQMVTFVLIALKGVRVKRKGHYQWKGRKMAGS
jgi:chlorobactene glucosyltransferase